MDLSNITGTDVLRLLVDVASASPPLDGWDMNAFYRIDESGRCFCCAAGACLMKMTGTPVAHVRKNLTGHLGRNRTPCSGAYVLSYYGREAEEAIGLLEDAIDSLRLGDVENYNFMVHKRSDTLTLTLPEDGRELPELTEEMRPADVAVYAEWLAELEADA